MGGMTFQRDVRRLDRAVSVRHAVREMAEHQVGAILVVDGKRPVGIFTERDLLRRVVDRGLDPEKTRIEEVMSPDILTIHANMRIDKALELMKHRNLRHLPVVLEGTDDVVGIVSVSNLGHLAAEESRTLFAYITGGYHSD
jgi:CBS domain-containing protein